MYLFLSVWVMYLTRGWPGAQGEEGSRIPPPPPLPISDLRSRETLQMMSQSFRLSALQVLDPNHVETPKS